MSDGTTNFFEKFENDLVKLKKLNPDVVAGFSGLFAKTMKEGVLSIEEKELIALGMGLVCRCEPCIKLHVKKCLDAGVSKEKIMDTATVAVMMGGGPVYTHLSILIETLEELGAL